MESQTVPSVAKAQRKTILIKRTLQLKYISIIFAIATLAMMIVGIDLYYMMYKLIVMDNPSLVPLLHHANSVLFLRAILYLCIVFVVSLIVSHRLAGPIYRFEKSAQIVGSGNLTHRVSLRTGDELLELQEEFNSMVSSLQSLIQKDRNLIQRLSSRLESLRKELPESAATPALLENIRSLRTELEHITAGFKV
jgi:methyl-accepting chemotaxis protein